MRNKIEYRLNSPVAGAIEARAGELRSAGIAARTMAQRYAAICDRSRPELNPDEWLIVVEAALAQGRSVDLRHWMSRAVELIGHGLATDALADPGQLIRRLRDMSYAEAATCLDIADRYHAIHGADALVEDLALAEILEHR